MLKCDCVVKQGNPATNRQLSESQINFSFAPILLLTMRVILALAFGLGAASALKEGRKYYETKVRFSRA